MQGKNKSVYYKLGFIQGTLEHFSRNASNMSLENVQRSCEQALQYLSEVIDELLVEQKLKRRPKESIL